MAIDEVNERTSWFADVSFTDENGDPVASASAHYRIDDVQSSQEIRGETEITELSETVRIMWEPSDTAILDESHAYETRRLTVSWTYMSMASPSAECEGHAEYLLNVINLRGVTTPSPA